MQNSEDSPRGELPPALRSSWRYNKTAIALHWLLVLSMAAMAVLGWIMVDMEEQPGSARYFNLHKSLGLLIALLVVTRIAWRLAHRVEELPATVPTWEIKLSSALHLLLYVLMVLIPVVGYVGASYSTVDVTVFGFPTPHWAPSNDDVAERVFDIHSALVWVFIVLVVIHALGALKHFLLDKDGVFQRMWFKYQR